MTQIQLTSGSCARLHHATPEDEDLFNSPHTVQFLSIKKVTPTSTTNNPSVDRYRIILSDGINFVQAMLATQLNHLVQENAIGKHTVATIEKLTCNYVQEKRLIIILSLRVLSKEEEKIGNPVAIGKAEQTENSPAPAAPVAASSAVSTSTSRPAPPQQSRPAPPKGARSGSVYLIEGLSPYQNNWTIKARVTQKSEIKKFANQRGEGQLFNVTLMDESGEIRGTGFNAVVDELYPKLEEGKVYYISKARVNLAKKKFSNLTNDYELSFERNTEVEECLETTNLPMMKYNFVPLAGLQELAKDATCDVIGVVKDASSLNEITSKMGRQISKRDLTLVDRSNFSIRITLWGKQAEQYNEVGNPVIAFKGVKVGDFGGRSLSLFSSSTMVVNPQIEECYVLEAWWKGEGQEGNFQAYTSNDSGSGGSFNRDQVRNINNVKESQLGTNDNPDPFSIRATIMHIRSENISYPACTNGDCKKKVVQIQDGWRCEKCNLTHPKPEHRYIISMAVADWSGQAWLQGFNDAGLIVFGMPADDLVEIRERDEEEYNRIFKKASCNTFNFACRAKKDEYNDQVRVRYGILRMMPLDYKEEARVLTDLLHSPWAR